ncbi:hypothetical protein [Paraburkholderia lycopersici]|uniref:hypothetical protein n=1 Tax=Paraburkholderia lycopersici TaxID=416944 RepID=UPI000B89DCDB|nr:hypothetical protein [Paraburkholderia lycopersici]
MRRADLRAEALWTFDSVTSSLAWIAAAPACGSPARNRATEVLHARRTAEAAAFFPFYLHCAYGARFAMRPPRHHGAPRWRKGLAPAGARRFAVRSIVNFAPSLALLPRAMHRTWRDAARNVRIVELAVTRRVKCHLCVLHDRRAPTSQKAVFCTTRYSFF